jgi:hypothetical protein
MSSIGDLNALVEVPGLTLQPVQPRWVASIRFFDPDGEFVAGLAARAGGPLPGPQQALRHFGADAAEVLMASRSPNETLMMGSQPGTLSAIEEFCAGRNDGCVVNQTGAVRVWEVSGARAADFWARLGSTPLPSLNEARMGRVAELTVMTVCVPAGRTLLLVDRLYVDHFAGWVAATLADF